MIFRGGAIAAAFLLCGACAPGAGPASGALPAVDPGARLYTQNCVPCHRDEGQGVPTVYPSLAGSAVVNGDPLELARWVLSGRRPASMPAGRYSTQMLVFGWMKDPEAAQLLTYIRANFGNRSGAVDEPTVVRARAGG